MENQEMYIVLSNVMTDLLKPILDKLNIVETNMNLRFELLEAKIDRVEAGLNARIDQVEAGLNARIDQVEAGLNARIDQVEASLNARIDQVEASLMLQINELKNRMDHMDMIIENEHKKLVEIIAENFPDLRILNDRAENIRNIEINIQALNDVVAGHSEAINRLEKSLS